jgi:hypothetical protein
MAYREVDMREISEVLRRLQRGEPSAAIERVTGRTRKTIGRYKQRARKLGWEPGGEREPDKELAAAVARSVRPVTEDEGGEIGDVAGDPRDLHYHDPRRNFLRIKSPQSPATSRKRHRKRQIAERAPPAGSRRGALSPRASFARFLRPPP